MRRPTYYRNMRRGEESYARDLFRGTLPRSCQIAIGDGLGLGDRPWTDTGCDPQAGAPFMSYMVNVGDMADMDLTSTDCFGGFGRICDTFIHELTHVWQYYHKDFVKTGSVAAQVWEELSDKIVFTPQGIRVQVVNEAYEYRPLDRSKSWDDYNPEQQAHIVEVWNYDRAQNDELYPFIAEVIRSNGKRKARGLSLDELRSHLVSDVSNTPFVAPIRLFPTQK